MKVLLCGKSFPEASRRLMRHLSKSRHELIVRAEQEIDKYLDEVDVVIPAMARIDTGIVERCRFDLIQQFASGWIP
jgi:hypothetical protein